MRSVTSWARQLAAGLRLLLILTVVLGIAYPLLITGVAQLPGLKAKADGSLLTVSGHTAGSSLIGQSFSDADGNPLTQYFQPRPSAAGAGYDPTASGASNLGPESIVDTLPDPSVAGDQGKPGLLTQVCTRSLAVGALEGVSGARPYCTSDGRGAVLAVFYSGASYTGSVTRVVSLNQACPAKPFVETYAGVAVACATFGADYAAAKVVAIRGDAPATPAVPADAVTASGSGLDPDISPAYAKLQEVRVARVRGISVAAVAKLVDAATTSRALGFLGQPAVNVVTLNLALDAQYPA